MRLAVVLALAPAACSFRAVAARSSDASDAATTDAPDAMLDEPDAPPDAGPARCCPATDPHLRMCFSFDQATLPASLP